jgi:hypothetical protein
MTCLICILRSSIFSRRDRVEPDVLAGVKITNAAKVAPIAANNDQLKEIERFKPVLTG